MPDCVRTNSSVMLWRGSPGASLLSHALLGRASRRRGSDDTSPLGLGGVLMVNGAVVEYFASPIGSVDETLLCAQSGDCASQQVLGHLRWLCDCGLHCTWSQRALCALTLVFGGAVLARVCSHMKRLSTCPRSAAAQLSQNTFLGVANRLLSTARQ